MAVLAPINCVSQRPKSWPFCNLSLDLANARVSFRAPTIFFLKLKSGEIEQTTNLKLLAPFNNPSFRLKASRNAPGLTQELANSTLERVAETENGCDFFDDMKQRFLNFKKHKYLENVEHFQNLAKSQAPKFMVVACADSRVCPSNILGFQPGEAFIVRNVANLVPPFESGPSETNAALEFAINSLEVENVLVVGHSCCGGIRALMSMQDGVDSSSFIKSWVVVGKDASLRTKAAASSLSFDQQCRHCEKESVDHSLLNLITYPWIKEKVAKGLLSLHGGYYDFVSCTFEKWTLDYAEDCKLAVKNRSFWS